MNTTDQLTWIKSSYSGGAGGECLEIAPSHEDVRIRDSKQPNAAQLAVTTTTWKAFVESVRS
ncbi:DUF397 domain-containing protein [Streptomyces sp. KLOTTS4A1]|uniref:DUF397 domain-containing protein n=1 Tax=Streptomyces sp. KLOTTS4A1 TaxID=3390996 RepID=UPI0039F57E4C